MLSHLGRLRRSFWLFVLHQLLALFCFRQSARPFFIWPLLITVLFYLYFRFLQDAQKQTQNKWGRAARDKFLKSNAIDPPDVAQGRRQHTRKARTRGRNEQKRKKPKQQQRTAVGKGGQGGGDLSVVATSKLFLFFSSIIFWCSSLMILSHIFCFCCAPHQKSNERYPIDS